MRRRELKVQCGCRGLLGESDDRGRYAFTIRRSCGLYRHPKGRTIWVKEHPFLMLLRQAFDYADVSVVMLSPS
jgi:hypothetical protein